MDHQKVRATYSDDVVLIAARTAKKTRSELNACDISKLKLQRVKVTSGFNTDDTQTLGQGNMHMILFLCGMCVD